MPPIGRFALKCPFFQVCLQLSGGPSSSPLGPHPYRNVQSGHAKWLTMTTRHELVIGVGHREANLVQFELQDPLSASSAHGSAVLICSTPTVVVASVLSLRPFAPANYMDPLLLHCPLAPAEYLEPSAAGRLLGACAIRGGSSPPSTWLLLALSCRRPVPGNLVYHRNGLWGSLASPGP